VRETGINTTAQLVLEERPGSSGQALFQFRANIGGEEVTSNPQCAYDLKYTDYARTWMLQELREMGEHLVTQLACSPPILDALRRLCDHPDYQEEV